MPSKKKKIKIIYLDTACVKNKYFCMYIHTTKYICCSYQLQIQ